MKNLDEKQNVSDEKPLLKMQAQALAGAAKVATMQKKPAAFWLSSILAGLYIGLGLYCASVADIYLSASEYTTAYGKFAFAAVFCIGLTLVLSAGADLFTGSNMSVGSAIFNKKLSPGEAFKYWGLCYAGNLIGSILLASLIVATGPSPAALPHYAAAVSLAKTSQSFLALFAKGVLCNILVCLAVFVYAGSKDKTAGLIAMALCIFCFVLVGFEHSVANMTAFSLSSLFKMQDESLQVAGAAGIIKNLLAVTLGNMAGGVFFVAYPYYKIEK